MSDFDVSAGPILIRGQVSHGHAVGVRLGGLDVIVFAPTREDALAFISKLPSDTTLYGENRKVRCVLAGEEQVSR